ncbi:hypothetical protein MishRS11D_42420 (plasmid) [Methylomagnum ishizawai]|nr:hypothetical protein MishRS11D_42420 [Methylomagnum ishizawai]
MVAMVKPKLAVFSPLPPRENGIADYTHEILPWHAQDFEVTVVLEDNHPAPSRGPGWDGIATVFLAEYLARSEDYADHVHLYHVGNNPDHVYMLPIMLERPGVVVLHDVSLHHLMDCATLRYGDFAAYTALLEREYGAAGRLLGEQFERYRWRERAMFYELPLTRTLLARAQGVVVHSAFAYFKAKAQSPDTPAYLIPHHLTPVVKRVDGLDRQEVRAKLGLEDAELVLLSLGFITKAKQIDAVLRCLAALRDQLPPFRYVLAGARLPDQFDVDAAIVHYDLEDVVIVTDYLDEAAFFDCIAAADLVVNLRYPTGGETSGTLIRALGCGACVVVVDHGPFAELPDDVCVKVPWSEHFDASLTAALLETIHNPALREEIGHRAKRFLRDRHAIARSAAAYRDALSEARARPDQAWGVPAPHRLLGLRPLQALLGRAGPPPPGQAWAREALLPEAQAHSRLVLAGDESEARTVWLDHYGYRAGQTARLAENPPERGADAALYAAREPAAPAFQAALAALNHALAFGGVLVVDLVRGEAAVSGMLDDPRRIEAEIARAGFKPLKRALGGPSDVAPGIDFSTGTPAAEPPFEACWQAVKVSEFIAPRPPTPVAPNQPEAVA